MTKEIEKIEEVLEKYKITMVSYEKEYELETYTKAGVNMIFYIAKKGVKFIEKFKNLYEGYLVDDEIEMHRQDSKYKKDFTIRQSLEDFEELGKRLEKIMNTLDKLDY